MAGLLGAVLVGFVVAVGLLTPIQGTMLWNEAGKGAITALSIAVVGGFVKLLFDQLRLANHQFGAYCPRSVVEEENGDVTKARRMVTGHLDQLKTYLDAVLDEYGRNYKIVSGSQSFDEKVTSGTSPQLYDFLAEAERSC